MRSPWKSFAAVETTKEYVALVSFLPLKSIWGVPKFLKYSIQIQRQLADSKGLIGYSLEAQIFNKKFWTLSIWENQEAMDEFVKKAPHSRIMAALAPQMGKTKFVPWKIAGSAVPPDWSAAKKRLE